MKPSSLSTLSLLLLLASACGVERIELGPPSDTGPAELPGADDPTPMVSVDGQAPVVPDEPVSSVDERPDFTAFVDPELPEPPVLLPGIVSGCSKLDLLFVLDNSFSMLDAQSKVSAAFPGLLGALGQTAGGNDLHVMVTDSDDWDGIGIQFGAGECEDRLGVGKRTSSLDDDCGLPGSERFITSAQPELDTTFDCVADVGAFGDSGEHTMDALLEAISPELNGAGGCNAGFLRSDAILVAVVVTDEDDSLSSGDAEVWHQALLDAKGGDEDALVVLGVVGDNNVDGGLPGGPCSLLGADGTPELQRFVQLNRHHALASVCAADYAPFFEQSTSIVSAACNVFVPR
jgi:hypothetical protein